MRLSDLLRCRVVDAAGIDVGPVEDVRLVQDGPYVEGFGAGLRIEGLAVGHRRIARRLGYLQGIVTGPWLFRVLFGPHRRGSSRWVPWEQVAEVTADEVRLLVTAASLAERPD